MFPSGASLLAPKARQLDGVVWDVPIDFLVDIPFRLSMSNEDDVLRAQW